MKQKKPRKIRLCRSQRRMCESPVLVLEGVWLLRSGFDVGDLVQITPGKKKLTVKVIEKWKSKTY